MLQKALNVFDQSSDACKFAPRVLEGVNDISHWGHNKTEIIMTHFVVLCMLNHCDTVMAYLESSREHVHYHLSLLEKTNKPKTVHFCGEGRVLYLRASNKA